MKGPESDTALQEMQMLVLRLTHSPRIGSDLVVGPGALAARCLVGGLSVAGRLPQDGPPGGVRHRVRFGDARLGRRGAC